MTHRNSALVAIGTKTVFVLACVACVVLPGAAQGGQRSHRPIPPAELEGFAPHFCMVNIHLKRSETELPASFEFGNPFDGPGNSAQAYGSFLAAKKPLRLGAIVIGPDTVLTIDTILDDEYLDYVEVEDRFGRTSRAERSALLVHAPALLFTISDPDKLSLKPVTFEGGGNTSGGEGGIYEVRPSFFADTWTLYGFPLYGMARFSPQGETTAVLRTSIPHFQGSGSLQGMILREMTGAGIVQSSPSLLVDENFEPIGIATAPSLSVAHGEAPLWYGPDLLADRRMSFPDLLEHRRALEDATGDLLLPVKVAFRQKAEEESDSPFYDTFLMDYDSMGFADDQEVPTEAFYFGLPVGPRVLFVPGTMERQFAKKIESIEVTTGESTVKGTFAGALEDYAAFFVAVDTDLPSPPLDLASAPSLDTFTPLLTLRAEHRFGASEFQTNYSRLLRHVLGYRDLLEPIMLGQQPPGTLYLDRSGTVTALLLKQRTEGEEFADLTHRFSPWQTNSWYRVCTAAELASYIASPDSHLDPSIVALSEKDEERRMWLGVEYEPMARELAKTLNLEKPTKGGAIGLLISQVYPNSPADRLGIAAGDVLLRISENEKEPVELRSSQAYDFASDFGDFELPPMAEGMGFSMPERRPWKDRKNYLTQLLEVFGEHQDLTLQLFTGGSTVSKTFPVEKAPPDYAGARKIRDDDLGLTVKQITYEVRYSLRIPDESNPVIVAKVEEGSPAAVARIRQYDLVTRIGDVDLDGLDAFQRAIDGASRQREEEGQTVLRFTVQRLGKSRIANVNLD